MISTDELRDMAEGRHVFRHGDGLALAAELIAARAKIAAADALAEAVKVLGLRALVAGWNGEGRAVPHTPHPRNLGATIPTTAGTVYDLDATLTAWEALK